MATICGRRSAFIIPTTRGGLQLWSELIGKGGLDLSIGRGALAGVLPPDQALSRIGSYAEVEGINVAVFSDQLVSAVDAPILVERDGVEIYLSSTEIILSKVYGFDLLFYKKEMMTRISSCAEVGIILTELWDYLSACEKCDDDWMVRSMQTQRHVQFRRTAARIRAQYIRSSLLHMVAIEGDPWRPQYNDKLEVLARIHVAGGA